jgi:hypothetical protein
MEKWEYLMVHIDAGRIFRVNGQQFENSKTTSVLAYINQLGNDGWEMAATSTPNGSEYILFFKRRKP